MALLEGADFQDAVRTAVQSGLGLLGESGREAMLYYLAERGIDSEAIPDRVAGLVRLLDEILGPGAGIIEAKIAGAIRDTLGCTVSARTSETLRTLEGPGRAVARPRQGLQAGGGPLWP